MKTHPFILALLTGVSLLTGAAFAQTGAPAGEGFVEANGAQIYRRADRNARGSSNSAMSSKTAWLVSPIDSTAPRGYDTVMNCASYRANRLRLATGGPNT